MMAFNVNQFMMNPWTNMGLGTLAASRPGVPFGQALGAGMLSGMQNLQLMQEAKQTAEARQLNMERIREQMKKAKQDVAMQAEMDQRSAEYVQQNPELAGAYALGGREGALDAYMQQMRTQLGAPNEFGTSVQYLQDKSTGKVIAAQASKGGGLFVYENGQAVPVDWNRYDLIKPYSLQDIGGSFVPYQSMTGRLGMPSQASAIPQGQYIEPGETLSPESPLVPGPDGTLIPNPVLGYQKTIPPEQLPEFRAAQTAAVKSAEQEVKKTYSKTQMQGKLNTVERDAETARNQIRKLRRLYTPMVGATTGIASGIPFTAQKSIANTIETLKAQIGFQGLQEMRDNSPTGGALGQVAIQELVYLQSRLGTLDPADEEFLNVLTDIENVINRIENAAQQQFAADYGTAGGWNIQKVQ